MIKQKLILACLTAALLSVNAALAQTTLAGWTFETSVPAGTPGAGVWFTNVAAEAGSGTASGLHAGNAAYSSTAGNGSAHSFSANTWAVGDFYQFAASTTNYQGISISFDQVGSGTGPGQFNLQYSIDGINFTQFGYTYSVTSAPSWSGTSAKTGESYAFDLSSINGLNNKGVVYFRLVMASTVTAGGSAPGTSGTSRVDNFVVAASSPIGVSGAPQIFTDVKSTNVYAGRTVTFNVIASGSDPLTYQWYYPNLSAPLSDGGNISGSASAALTLSSVTTNQIGNYQVIIHNSFGSVTSSIANLQVKLPITTNIAYLRTLQDPVNWAPTDTTNLYTVQGTVTTVVNLTTTGNSEFFIQDGTGGIAVFVSGGSYVPDQGTVVQVTGPLGQFDGLLELNLVASNPDHSVTAIGGGPLPAPQIFNFSSSANIPFMEATEGSLVVVSNVYLGSTNSSFVSGNVTLTNLSGQTFTLFVHANSTDIIGQSIPPFATSIIGVLSQFKSTAPYTSGYELDITQSSDLVAGTPPVIVPSIPLNIQLSGGSLVLTWSDSSFALQSATNVAGPYSTITGAASGFTTNANSAQVFFRLIH
jgi:hypothetical protein